MGAGQFNTLGALEQRVSTSRYTQKANGLKTSRSDPALVPFSPTAVSVKVINSFYIIMQNHSYAT